MNRSERLKIFPSLASADSLNLINEIDRLKGISDLHLDVEDGVFVPNITFGDKTIKRVAQHVGKTKSLDVHLLVREPHMWIDRVACSAVKKIAVHIEALAYPLEALAQIHRHNIEAGIALNFSTPAEAILPFRKQIDYVIVMTAEPDGLGMQFNPDILEKIKKVKDILGSEGQVWADGGVSKEHVKSVYDAGAANVVMGRAVFGDKNPLQAIQDMVAICEN